MADQFKNMLILPLASPFFRSSSSAVGERRVRSESDKIVEPILGLFRRWSHRRPPEDRYAHTGTD